LPRVMEQYLATQISDFAHCNSMTNWPLWGSPLSHESHASLYQLPIVPRVLRGSA
jgi:hypothetical protein